MGTTTRVLTWVIRILWIVVLLLPVSAAFSFSQVFQPNNVSFYRPVLSASNGMIIASSSFYINNTGFYDLSNVIVSIAILENNKSLGNTSRTLAGVPAGEKVSSSLDFSFAFSELASNHRFLLTNDTSLDLTLSLSSHIAYVLTFGVSINDTIPWGAPFYNLTLSNADFESSTQTLSIQVYFENHSSFSIAGTLRLEMLDNEGGLIGFSDEQVNVLSATFFNSVFGLAVDPLKITSSGVAHVYFDDNRVYEAEWTL